VKNTIKKYQSNVKLCEIEKEISYWDKTEERPILETIRFPMTTFFETERLILREILPTDIEGMYELDSDPDVHRYLGNNPVSDKGQTSEIIDSIRQQYIDNGIGRWAIIDKETNDFVGWSGLKYITEEINGHHHFYDLGYRLVKRYWGKGIATEAAISSLQYGFKMLDIREVFAMVNCENEESNKILTKVGFTFVNVFELDDIRCNWYKMERSTL